MPVSSNSADKISVAPLQGFAPSIARLLALGLPAKRIAELFETTPDNVYVLAHRHRKSQRRHAISSTTPGMSLEDDDKAYEAKRALRIRTEEDAVEFTRRKATSLSLLESRMDGIVRTGRDTYRFLEAARALQNLKPLIGYPAETNRLRLAAKMHQHLAWFYSHSGLSSSSITEATHSIGLYQIVYHNTGDKDALRELGGSCLIRSNSCLIQGLPEAAATTLDLAREATTAAGVPLNSEFYQQSGVALFQTRQDRAAKKMFESATRTTPDTDVKNGTMTLKMASDRFLNLIEAPFPRLDEELVMIEEATSVYGEQSLESAMCRHWSAACGLVTDSPSANQLALELIETDRPYIARFGHQATISRLLPIALELPSNLRPLWVRFALYQNAFRAS